MDISSPKIRWQRSQKNNMKKWPNKIQACSLRRKGRGSTILRLRRSFGSDSCPKSFSKKLEATFANRATKRIQGITTHSRAVRPTWCKSSHPAIVCSKSALSTLTPEAYQSNTKTLIARRTSLQWNSTGMGVETQGKFDSTKPNLDKGSTKTIPQSARQAKTAAECLFRTANSKRYRICWIKPRIWLRRVKVKTSWIKLSSNSISDPPITSQLCPMKMLLGHSVARSARVST